MNQDKDAMEKAASEYAEDYWPAPLEGYDAANLRETFQSGWQAAHSGPKVIALRDVLEAVRSQMCWERDRDQLTMGMIDLHTAVTKTLAEFEGDE